MSPELLKGFFRAGIFVAGTSIFLLLIVEPNSAEFVVTVLSLCIGVLLMVSVGVVAWWFNR